MPGTVIHQLTATTPDNTSYEIRPSHWNSSHAVSLAVAGLEVIGAFSNGGNVSFGTNLQSAITANAPVQTAQPVAVSGSNGSFAFSTLSLGNLNGLSLYSSNGSVVGSYTVPGTAGLLSAVNLSAGTTSGNITGAVFSNSNGVSFGLNAGTVTGSVAAQTNQSAGLYALGNTTQNSSTTLDARSLSFNGLGELSVGYSNGSIQLSVPPSSVGVSNLGNTSGNTGTYSGQVIFAGGNNITLSVASGAGGAQTITISGANAGGAQTGISGVQVSNTTYTAGTVTFQNANGISFGSSGANGISASYTVPSTAGLLSNVNLSAGTTSGNLSAFTLSNSNGVSFGLNGGTVTGSVAAQTVQTQNVHNLTLSGNTAGVMAQVSSGTLSLAGGNNITLSQNGNAITISGANAGGAQTGISGLQISNTTYTSGTVTFQNANGISFGSSGANGISASYTVPSIAGLISAVNLSAGTTSGNLSAMTFSNSNGVSFGLNGSTITGSVAAQSNQALSLFALGNTTQNSSTVLDARSLSFNGLGAATLGYSNGSVQVSVPVQTAQTQSNIQAISAGTTSANTGAIVFSNSNGVSFGLNGQTITGSVNATGAPNFSAGTTSSNLGSVVFSNSNGVSFGLNGSTITGSVAAQTNQSVGIYGVSQTTGQSSSSTYDARSLSFAGYGVISIGQSGGTVQISGPATTAFAGISISAGTTSNGLSSIVFSNSNGVSFGLNGSTMTGSVATSLTNINVSAGTTSNNLSALTFSNSNGVSFGLNGSVITASAAAGGGAALSAGTQSTNGNTVVFSNSNNVSFGMTNSSIITASASYSQVSSVGLYALGNTTQNSSTTLDQRTLSFNALGAMTMGYSNGSIQVSAPATSSISGTGGISVAVNGSTISIGNAPLTRAIFPGPYITALSAPGQGSASIQYVPTDLPITATRIDALVSWAAASSATTNTGAIALSAWAAIYTRNGSTLSSLSSGSTQTTYTYASNTAGNTQLITGAMRPVSVPVNVNMVPGEYFVAFNFSTNSSSIGLSTTNLAQTLSMMGANNLQTAANYAEFTTQTATSSNLFGGMGVYSAQTAGLPAAISLSAINQTGAALSQANIALVFRNA